jgi:hypothetical protein
MPIPEGRAYAVAQAFYREALRQPLGTATSRTQTSLLGKVPAYAWAALAIYGDHALELPSLSGDAAIAMSGDSAHCWHSHLRTYAVLQTRQALSAALETLGEAPPSLRPYAEQLLDGRRAEPPQPASGTTASPGLLSVRAVTALQRARTVGLDAKPIVWPARAEAEALMGDLVLAVRIGGALSDQKLMGLASALLGRLVTWYENSITTSRRWLERGNEKLAPWEDSSPYIARIRQETRESLRKFGALPS